MAKRWVTADWHLGEDRMAIMQRPFVSQRQMIETLVEKHNAFVGDDDTVYVVGDVCYQKTPEFLPEVERFNGNKILFRGNHDRAFTDEQLSLYFDVIVPEGDGMELQVVDFENSIIECYLTHYPICGLPDKFNLVGHIHGAWKYQLNMLNVGVDANHFMPHNIDEAVPFYLKAITNFYDDDVWIAYNTLNNTYVGKRGKQGHYFTR